MQGKQKDNKIGPIKGENGQILLDDTEKANSLNHFFATVSEKLAANHQVMNSLPATCTPPQPRTISDIEINDHKVQSIIKRKVKAGKSCGPDNVSAKDLSLFGESIAPGLALVMNECTEHSKFPGQWKLSKVRALFKKGTKVERENHRPISLLSIPSKLMEGVICEKIDEHFVNGGLSTPHQWAYKQGHSTETLLLHLTEIWKNELDNGGVIGVLFIDFKKAFDSVCHDVLKRKLKNYGFEGKLFAMLENYLKDRRQYVVVNGKSSTTEVVKYGVPQGSLLGPRLFSIHVNDLPEVPSQGQIEMFADDTEYYCVGKTEDEVLSALQVGINEISAWCSRNSLTIHPDKSEIMILSRRKFIGPMKAVKLENKVIKVVNESKCLGVTIDSKLKWKTQVKNAASSMNVKLKQIKRFRSLSPQTLEKIYFQGILPGSTYGIAVWGSGASLEALEKVHRRAAKVIHKLPKNTPEDKVLDSVNWKSIEYIYKRRVACLTHQIYNSRGPNILNELIQRKTSSRSMRDMEQLQVSRPKTEIGRSSFKHRAAILWNVLPTNVKTISSYFAFKCEHSKNSRILNSLSFGQSSTIKQRNNEYVYF